MSEKKNNVAIVTGPTGGHFFPGLAIGEELTGDGKSDVVFFVPNRKYLVVWLENKGFKYHIIPEVRFSLKNILFPLKFFYAFLRACLQMGDGGFDGVVITGSYATVPFLFAAKLYRAKIFVHEQNFLPGKVTKLSAVIADRIGLTFPFLSGLPKRKCVITGFPIIADFRKRYPRNQILDEFGFSTGDMTVLVLGGSQGAAFLNEMITRNIDFLKERKVQFLHLAGRDSELVASYYSGSGVKARVFDFYFDMARLYSAADIVICRAGAGTLAEISDRKLPAIVVPYPHAGGHQRYNALYFANSGGCKMLVQNTDSLKSFPLIINEFIKGMEKTRERIKEISISDSRGENVRQIMELLNEDKSN